MISHCGTDVAEAVTDATGVGAVAPEVVAEADGVAMDKDGEVSAP